MYFDFEPCRVCGATVDLEADDWVPEPDLSKPVGPADGVVGGGDPTVDRRVCTNPDCPTNAPDADTAP